MFFPMLRCNLYLCKDKLTGFFVVYLFFEEPLWRKGFLVSNQINNFIRISTELLHSGINNNEINDTDE